MNLTDDAAPEGVAHESRRPLTMDEVARVIASDIPAGGYINLGIGHPTKVADHLASEQGVVLHTENGMLGMGRTATGEHIDPDLTNAGKMPVTELPGAAYFNHADSFAMTRGGHLDICVLGAYQVAGNGDIANWHTGRPDDIPAVGGAMDLARGAKQVFAMMSLFGKDGAPKLVPRCTYPLTGRACVSRVYTDHGIFDTDPTGCLTLRRVFGVTVRELQQRLELPFAVRLSTGGLVPPPPGAGGPVRASGDDPSPPGARHTMAR